MRELDKESIIFLLNFLRNTRDSKDPLTIRERETAVKRLAEAGVAASEVPNE